MVGEFFIASLIRQSVTFGLGGRKLRRVDELIDRSSALVGVRGRCGRASSRSAPAVRSRKRRPTEA